MKPVVRVHAWARCNQIFADEASGRVYMVKNGSVSRLDLAAQTTRPVAQEWSLWGVDIAPRRDDAGWFVTTGDEVQTMKIVGAKATNDVQVVDLPHQPGFGSRHQCAHLATTRGLVLTTGFPDTLMHIQKGTSTPTIMHIAFNEKASTACAIDSAADGTLFVCAREDNWSILAPPAPLYVHVCMLEPRGSGKYVSTLLQTFQLPRADHVEEGFGFDWFMPSVPESICWSEEQQALFVANGVCVTRIDHIRRGHVHALTIAATLSTCHQLVLVRSKLFVVAVNEKRLVLHELALPPAPAAAVHRRLVAAVLREL